MKIIILKKIAHDLDQIIIDLIEQKESNLKLQSVRKKHYKKNKKGKN